ncbi:hypothetical protein AAFF_G00148300 [Aldrovandia affinis]|uniref:Uncharacterized protein n=1 Tax=Aldrovandia affinis TaxID=143900 RepID=A0AAD7VXL7_9TELE|nr:hypothetical protein AAFF_G00148300 [Aldrovandia affinis]
MRLHQRRLPIDPNWITVRCCHVLPLIFTGTPTCTNGVMADSQEYTCHRGISWRGPIACTCMPGEVEWRRTHLCSEEMPCPKKSRCMATSHLHPRRVTHAALSANTTVTGYERGEPNHRVSV